MRYKNLYICYLTPERAQKQKVFISKTTKNCKVTAEVLGDEEICDPIISVEFFETKQDALDDAEFFCHPEDIYMVV